MAIVGVASVKIKPDLSDFRKELKAGLAAINAELEVKITADTSRAKAQVEAFVAKESGKNITKKVDVDKNSLNQISTALDGFHIKSVLILTALGTIPGALHAIIPAVAALSGIVALLPAAALGFVAVLGTFKLGIEGISKAFQQLDPVMQVLTAKVSKSFQESLTPAVNNLKKLLPNLTTGFKEIATALGGVVTKFTTMLNKKENTQALSAVLDGTARIIKNIGSALAPLGQAFIQIAAIGTQVFVDMTKNIGASAQKFADFIATAKGTQAVKDAIQGAIDGFKVLFEIGKLVFQIIGDIFRGLAAGGSSPANGFITILQKIHDLLSGDIGQGFFTQLGRAFSELSRIVGGILGDAVKTVLPTITGFLKFIADHSDVFGPLIAGLIGMKVAMLALNLVMKVNPIILIASAVLVLIAAIKGADPVINALKKAWKAIQPILKVIGDTILPVLKQAWKEIKPPLDELINAFGRLFEALKPILKAFGSALLLVIIGAIAAIVAIIVIVAKLVTLLIDGLVWVIEAVITAIKAVVDWFAHFGENIQKILDFFGQIGVAIGDFFAGLAVTIATWAAETATDIFNWVVTTATDFAGWVASTASDFAGWVASTASDFAGWVASTASDFAGWVASTSSDFAGWVATTAGDFGSWVATTAGDFGSWVARTSSDFVSWHQRVQGSFNNWASSTLSTIGSWISNTISDFGNWLGRVVDFFASLPGRALSALGNLGGVLIQAGRNLIEGLLNGIKQAAAAVWDFVSGIAGKIASLKGPLPFDLRLLVPAGLAIMEGLSSGLESGFKDVTALVAGMAPSLADSFGNTQFALASSLSANASIVPGDLSALAPQVNVNLSTNDALFKDLVDVQISEGNRETRRNALTGGAVFQ